MQKVLHRRHEIDRVYVSRTKVEEDELAMKIDLGHQYEDSKTILRRTNKMNFSNQLQQWHITYGYKDRKNMGTENIGKLLYKYLKRLTGKSEREKT